jgi:DNA-binding winged helix-turn-helix (wHTH) protein/Tol biopolymer transport system component
MTAETDRSDFKSPVDLAREADFPLGASRVSPSSREVVRGTEHEMLEPRVMQVLVALFQANGRVVSRDELIARCWEGRIVGEDAINRAIGRLRRLSEVDREASFVIETIPRVGYRLLPGIAVQAEPGPATASAADHSKIRETSPTDAPPPASGRWLWRHRWLAAGLALLAVIVSALSVRLMGTGRHWVVENSRPFISTLELEDYPAFSPNGTMLAYASGPDGGQRQVYVRNLAGGEAIKITKDTYDDISPIWSSDGAHLAYVASKPGEPCHIMIAAVPAGETREVGRCHAAESSVITWQPGSSFVYSVERSGLNGDVIWRLNLDTGASQAVVRKKALRDVITSLRCSPDGKWLVYLLRGEEIIVHEAAGGSEKSLGNISRGSSGRGSLGWAPDSAAVLATFNRGAGGSEIVTHPLDGSAPYRIYTTSMKIGNFASTNGLLALVTDISRTNLARASAAPASVPDIIDASSGLTWSPSFAPDGTLAFLSNRSGTSSIWLMKPGAPPAMLVDGSSAPLDVVAFSPDGTRLAVAAQSANSATIKILTRAGATLSSFDMPSLGLGLPSWTLDGKEVITFDRRCLCTWRFDAANPSNRKLFAAPHWIGIAVREDGTFATRADSRGIWRIDQGVKQINSTYPNYYEPPLAFRGEDVLVPEYSAGSVPRILAQPVSGGPARIVAYAPGAANQNGLQTAFAVNPTNGEIIYVASVMRDTNIDLLTLARR